MSQLLVRGIEEEIINALKRQAAANGRSTEAEHREILRSHLTMTTERRPFKEVLAEMPDFDDDELFDVR